MAGPSGLAFVMYYTYGHYKADSKELFYIGKGSKDRAYERDSRSDYWRNIVAKHDYTVEVLAHWPTEEEAFQHEKFLIECFRDLTVLCNLTDGGEGCSGYVWTDEQKQKLKLRVPGRLGKTFTAEQREKIGAAQRGKKRGPHSEDHKAKIALAIKGKQKSKEQVKKMKQTMLSKEFLVLCCPTCGHEGRGPNMYRYHFKNCKG